MSGSGEWTKGSLLQALVRVDIGVLLKRGAIESPAARRPADALTPNRGGGGFGM